MLQCEEGSGGTVNSCVDWVECSVIRSGFDETVKSILRVHSTNTSFKEYMRYLLQMIVVCFTLFSFSCFIFIIPSFVEY